MGSFISMDQTGLGFKSVNVGKTEISGVETSINGQGKINENLSINIIKGYTFMNPIPLNPSEVYCTNYRSI